MAMTFDTPVEINAGKYFQTNKLNLPTAPNGLTYGPGSNGQVIKSNGTSVYWGDDLATDNKVEQTNNTSNASYNVLFSMDEATTTSKTNGTYKTTDFTYNPNTKALVTGGTVNGYTLNSASEKSVTDNTSSVAPSSTDTNLITGRTLYNAIASTSEIDALFN